jgi:hypothetical protein
MSKLGKNMKKILAVGQFQDVQAIITIIRLS